MHTTPIKVVITDDQVMVAEGISAMLEQQPDFEILSTVYSGESLLTLLETARPDVVLLDLNMPVMDGFKACELVREKFPQVVVVALTSYDDDKMRQRIEAAGAAGMLLKYVSAAELAESIRQVMAEGNSGPFITTHSDNKENIAEQTSKDDAFLLKHKITGRELQVAKLIATGLNSEEIAKKLFLSEHTVKTHRKNVLDKLRLNNSAELVSFIYKHNVI